MAQALAPFPQARLKAERVATARTRYHRGQHHDDDSNPVARAGPEPVPLPEPHCSLERPRGASTSRASAKG
jgi:hypothetical protein